MYSLRCSSVKLFIPLCSILVGHLLSLAEETEHDVESEITYEDIVQPQKSTFEKLMSQPKNLEVGNYNYQTKTLAWTITIRLAVRVGLNWVVKICERSVEQLEFHFSNKSTVYLNLGKAKYIYIFIYLYLHNRKKTLERLAFFLT